MQLNRLIWIELDTQQAIKTNREDKRTAWNQVDDFANKGIELLLNT